MGLNSIHKKVAGASAGTTGRKKTDGYAKGPVPMASQATKPGVVPGHGYSGPDVAQVSRKNA